MVQRIDPVMCRMDVVTAMGQSTPDKLADRWVILDNKHLCHIQIFRPVSDGHHLSPIHVHQWTNGLLIT